MYDIIIVGAGPAGAVFAASVDKSFSVLVIDRKKEQGGFMKPCGGLLAPDAQKALAQLGLNLPKDVLAHPQIFSVRTVDMDNGLVRNYQRMYVNLDRHRFDMWLMSEIPENVAVKTGVVTDIIGSDNGYRVTWTENGAEKSAECRCLIGADGAKSAVRRFIKPDYKCRSYMSVQQWFKEENPNPFYSCIFDSSITDCYSWTVSKDGCFIFGGAYPKKNARQLFEKQKESLSRIGMKFGEPIKTEACQVLRPSDKADFCCGKDKVFLIGEAAGFISPSSLEGISSAIISATKLSEIFNSKSENPLRAYKRATLPLRIKLLMKVLKCPFMYTPPIRKAVMKSGLMTIKVKNSDNKP